MKPEEIKGGLRVAAIGEVVFPRSGPNSQASGGSVCTVRFDGTTITNECDPAALRPESDVLVPKFQPEQHVIEDNGDLWDIVIPVVSYIVRSRDGVHGGPKIAEMRRHEDRLRPEPTPAPRVVDENTRKAEQWLAGWGLGETGVNALKAVLRAIVAEALDGKDKK